MFVTMVTRLSDVCVVLSNVTMVTKLKELVYCPMLPWLQGRGGMREVNIVLSGVEAMRVS